MAAAGLAVAAQLAPTAIAVTEAIAKATLMAHQIKSANLLNAQQWAAIWDMADSQFLQGYDSVMSIGPNNQTETPPATTGASMPATG